MCTGFNWLGAESSGGRLWTRYWTFRFHQSRKILDQVADYRLYKHSSPLHFVTRYSAASKHNLPGPRRMRVYPSKLRPYINMAWVNNLLINFIPNNVTWHGIWKYVHFTCCNPQATTDKCPVLVVYINFGHLLSSVEILLSIKIYAAIICTAFSLRIHWYTQLRSINQALHLFLQAASCATFATGLPLPHRRTQTCTALPLFIVSYIGCRSS